MLNCYNHFFSQFASLVAALHLPLVAPTGIVELSWCSQFILRWRRDSKPTNKHLIPLYLWTSRKINFLDRGFLEIHPQRLVLSKTRWRKWRPARNIVWHTLFERNPFRCFVHAKSFSRRSNVWKTCLFWSGLRISFFWWRWMLLSTQDGSNAPQQLSLLGQTGPPQWCAPGVS